MALRPFSKYLMINSSSLTFSSILNTHLNFALYPLVKLDCHLARTTGILQNISSSNNDMDQIARQLDQSIMISNDLRREVQERDERLLTLQKELECGICMQVYSIPISLPCSHVICYSCLMSGVFTAPSGKAEKTYFAVEKCPHCRYSIKLDLVPSIPLRILANLFHSEERKREADVDLQRLKMHGKCIRLGAHCTERMCLRAKSGCKAKFVADVQAIAAAV